MTDASFLNLSGITHDFPGGTRALQRLDLGIDAHSFTAILGPSGCGKSTLLRIVAGLLRPTEGRIDWPASTGRPKIGFVFQEPNLLPWANVFENVFLPLKLAGQSRRTVANRIGQLLDLVGLSDVAQAYPHTLSGGMKMRVSLARALVTDPDLLLLDEPFAALDEPTRFRLNEDLLRLWRERKFTAIFVTHSLFEAVFLSERVIALSPRPARIAGTLTIDLPQPRIADVRTSAAYGALCAKASQLLVQAAPA